MRDFTLNDLKEVFETLKGASCEGIPGVVRIDSGKPGPIVGITACTHGNEPCGLAAIKHIQDLCAPQGLLRGTLYLIVNNLEAAEKYFAASTNDEKKGARFISLNMNRLPDDVFETTEHNSEIRRVRELRPVFARLEYGLDIHSTTQDNGPMLIGVGEEIPMSLTRGFPMEKLISNIDQVQIGNPVCSCYGTEEHPAQVFGIECGAHEEALTYERACKSAETLLINLEMLPGEVGGARANYEEYWVYGSVMFPDTSYELTSVPPNFDFVPEGTVIARGNGPDIIASRDSHALMAHSAKPKDLSEEVFFLTEPVRERTIA